MKDVHMILIRKCIKDKTQGTGYLLCLIMLRKYLNSVVWNLKKQLPHMMILV